MGLKPGYKQTEVGVIPEDWRVVPITRITREIFLGLTSKVDYVEQGGGVPLIRATDIAGGRLSFASARMISVVQHKKLTQYRQARRGDVLVSKSGSLGVCAIVDVDREFSIYESIIVLQPGPNLHSAFLLCLLRDERTQKRMLGEKVGSSVSHLNLEMFRNLIVPLPPSQAEQRAIATALSDVDALLSALDALIAKKRGLKQAAMQQLLTGQTRLPGFYGKWQVKTLEQSADCLDGVRVPLNEAQRAAMKGDYPYCGANGVLDYVNGFVIDDDIILMAEDGGYFDEFETRPIAYRMKGKCWVNNHAHILKAKASFDQGFLFYSLVHKNILPFLASGTRAKLNKSEMNKIEVRFPRTEAEQSAIAEVLTDMDAEIAALDQRREKTRNLKQAMMQELLTGKTRLV
jgi:type I restriction enzyme S subunit